MQNIVPLASMSQQSYTLIINCPVAQATQVNSKSTQPQWDMKWVNAAISDVKADNSYSICG